MPSKYYNPRLARNAGQAQAPAYNSVSGVIDKAFEPLHEDIKTQQERLYKQQEETRKKNEAFNKDLGAWYTELNDQGGTIPQNHQTVYQEMFQSEFAKASALMQENKDDPVALAKIKAGLTNMITNVSSQYSSINEINKANIEDLDKNGQSDANSNEQLNRAMKSKNFMKNPNITYVNGKVMGIEVDEKGKPIIDPETGQPMLYDPVELAQNSKLINASGSKVHGKIFGSFGKILKQVENDNVSPEVAMIGVEDELSAINGENAFHIAITELKLGGAQGEYKEFLSQVFNDNSEANVYWDMPNDITLKQMNEFNKLTDEQKKSKGYAQMSGEHALIELVKDNYRYNFAETANKREQARIAKEEAAGLQAQKDKLALIEARKNKTGSGSTSTEEERIAGFQSIMPNPEDFSRTQTHRAGSLGSSQAPYHFDDDYKGIRYKKWENLMANALQKEGIAVKKGKSGDKDVLYVNAGTKSRPNWQELIPAEDNAETLAGLFPDKTFNSETKNADSIIANWKKRKKEKGK